MFRALDLSSRKLRLKSEEGSVQVAVTRRANYVVFNVSWVYRRIWRVGFEV